MGNACGLIAALSTDMKGPGLKLPLQNTIQPLVSVKIPEEIFAIADTSDNDDKDENLQDDILMENLFSKTIESQRRKWCDSSTGSTGVVYSLW